MPASISPAGAQRHPVTIASALRLCAVQRPAAPAILEGSLPPVSFADLGRQIRHLVGTLRALGVGPGEAVAVSATRGSAGTVALLGVMAGARAAPLDPRATAPEAATALRRLAVRLLLVQAGRSPGAREAAASVGIPVVELQPGSSPEERIRCLDVPSPAPPGPRPDQTSPALLLQTSGTTGQPKLVGLTHANILAATRILTGTLRLAAADRCLNVAPLHTTLGCVTALLARLLAGGAVVCVPSLDEDTIVAETALHQPTWYTASPAMQEVILAGIRRLRAQQRPPLRFVRSTSAPLPFGVLTEIEATLRVPVLDAYALTEAPGQVACNPLPPGRRKAGTVGIARGCRVGIRTDRGFAGRNELGQVMVSGPQVIAGYWGDSGEPGDVVDGWLRTGDIGFLDEDGYLVLTGRLQEQINRGGLKVTPAEVEAALLAHAGVREAAVFPVPHPTLGEDVGAVIVADALVTPATLRASLAESLAAFKVPRRILVVDRIPRAANGKIRRRSLAADLGLK